MKRNTKPQTDGAVTLMSNNDGVKVGELRMPMELISQRNRVQLSPFNKMNKGLEVNCQLGSFSTKEKGEQ